MRFFPATKRTRRRWTYYTNTDAKPATYYMKHEQPVPLERQAADFEKTVDYERRFYANVSRWKRAQNGGKPPPPLRLKFWLNSAFFAYLMRERPAYLDGLKIYEDPFLLSGANKGMADYRRATKPRPLPRKRPDRRR